MAIPITAVSILLRKPELGSSKLSKSSPGMLKAVQTQNVFFISNYSYYHRLVETYYHHLFKNFFSVPHYPHYLRLFKIYISTFFSNFFQILNYPHYHRQVETFFSTFIQLFIFQFPTTLTTTDKLKLFYQHLFKNFI